MKSVVRALAEIINGKGMRRTNLNSSTLPTRSDTMNALLQAQGVIFKAKLTQSSTNAPAYASNYAKITHPGLTYTHGFSSTGTFTLTISKTSGIETPDIVFNANKVFVQFQDFNWQTKLNIDSIAVTDGALVITYSSSVLASATQSRANIFTGFMTVTLL